MMIGFRASILAGSVALLAACSKPAPTASSTSADAAPTVAPSEVKTASTSTAVAVTAIAADIGRCDVGPGVTACSTFLTPEDAFAFVLDQRPEILAIGEAHAQKGTEGIASSTKRFYDRMLPMLAGKASDVVVELWAPDPACTKAVAAVKKAQKPVVEKQAASTQDEMTILGTRAKAIGITPWLLRPTCEDFDSLADAGADAIGPMLGLVKRLTQSKVTQLHAGTRGAAKNAPHIVVAYGGAMHNDMAPSADLAAYSFGPELSQLVGGKYVELDLIVPEYVKETPSWQKMPWYAAYKAKPPRRDRVALYRTGERSFAMIFAPNVRQ